MANKSNQDLWADVKNLRTERDECNEKNARLMEELDKLNRDIDKAAVTIDALEHEIRRLEKIIAGAPTEKKMAHECRTAYARGFREGRGSK